MNITFTKENLIPVHTLLSLEGEIARVAKTDNKQPDENTYVKIRETPFHNGIIEVDVKGSLLSNAPDYARGFIGIVFRVNDSDCEFESFYIRPTNGKGCDDSVRKAHGCQYFSYPGYTFSYFREFGITTYENQVDTIALNEWSHIRAEITDDSGIFFVDGIKVLEVQGLKHGAYARGNVGLYVDDGTDGFFKNLKITYTD